MWTVCLLLCALQARPEVAGVWFGDRPDAVRARLGEPEHKQLSLGLEFWDYNRHGLSVIWDRDRPALRVIVVKTQQAAVVQGVRVGDSVSVVRAQWGEPARARQHGQFVDFTRAEWVQTAELRRGRVVEITLTAR